jgi:hypothetical protein
LAPRAPWPPHLLLLLLLLLLLGKPLPLLRVLLLLLLPQKLLLQFCLLLPPQLLPLLLLPQRALRGVARALRLARARLPHALREVVVQRLSLTHLPLPQVRALQQLREPGQGRHGLRVVELVAVAVDERQDLPPVAAAGRMGGAGEGERQHSRGHGQVGLWVELRQRSRTLLSLAPTRRGHAARRGRPGLTGRP